MWKWKWWFQWEREMKDAFYILSHDKNLEGEEIGMEVDLLMKRTGREVGILRQELKKAVMRRKVV